MDVWLRMAWIDQRLAHHFDRPILINDENFLKLVALYTHETCSINYGVRKGTDVSG